MKNRKKCKRKEKKKVCAWFGFGVEKESSLSDEQRKVGDVPAFVLLLLLAWSRRRKRRVLGGVFVRGYFRTRNGERNTWTWLENMNKERKKKILLFGGACSNFKLYCVFFPRWWLFSVLRVFVLMCLKRAATKTR